MVEQGSTHAPVIAVPVVSGDGESCAHAEEIVADAKSGTQAAGNLGRVGAAP
jgi:hypothetical protein